MGLSALLATAGLEEGVWAQDASQPASEPPVEPPSEPAPAQEPIITDEALDAAIPDLTEDDPDLGQELEPIDVFDARFDALTPKAPDTALQEGEEDDRPPSPPLSDAELLQPLPSLESVMEQELAFEPQNAASAQATAELRYDWQVSGLEFVDFFDGVDIAGQFGELSTLEQGDGKAANVAMLAARLSDDKELLVRLLKAQGWYEAQVTGQLQPADKNEDARALATLTVEPGKRFTLAQINVEADATIPETLIEDALTVAPGDPIVAADILVNEAVVATVLPQNGYPLAKLGQREILLDSNSGDGVYTLPFETGPRARFGEIRVNEDAVFDAEHIADIARFETGELFDSRGLDDLRLALAATTLLRSFSVEPKPTGEDAGDGTEYVAIEVNQTAGPARTLAGTVGYGTGQGLRVEGSWAHRNLFPPEGALTGTLIAGTLEQGAGVSFRRANAGQRDRTFEVGVSALRSNFDAFEATTGRVGATYSYVSTPIWQKRITYAFGAEVLASVEEAFDIEANDFVDETYLIGAVFGQIGFDTSDDLLNPTRGFRLEALVQPEGSLEGGFTPYVRTVFDASAYVPAGDSFVMAGRARLGTLQGADGVDIAPSRRLYAGGGGSVRGFGFQELGPRAQAVNDNFDPDDPDSDEEPFTLEPIGGRSVIEASAEARYRFGDYGVVAFVDAGQVYRDTVPSFSDIRFGVGIGGRIYTNFGPLRVDIATPINRREGEGRLNVYVSIGQAF
ncbi:MAG: BamA/TamA family outer membrane protein [Pseudomonadota bacterium]